MEAEAATSPVVAAAAAVGVVGGGGGVRVVARICPASTTTAAAPDAAGTSLFQVAAARGRRPRASGAGAGAVLSFTPAVAAADPPPTPSASSSSQGRAAAGQRKEEHRLDWCYLEDETNHHVFVHELQPLLAHHLHNRTTPATASSSNACVVACGSAAAKDHLFKGTQDQPGLVTIAMEEILDFAASIGGAVRVSSYQVVQDTHIFDLLEPKDQEVLVLEDAQGKTHLKGLSKVHVKSIEDFAQLGCFDDNQDKQPTKASSSTQQQPKPFSTQQQPTKASSTQLSIRGHQGLIIHILCFDQDGKEHAVAKINFLSLTDYVDPKQKNGGGAAALSSSNKSMYTLMNVVQALNSNQSFVPYRQSKVTRLLQDSLCKMSRAVLIACLDEFSCQDTVSTLSLAARSSQVANEQCRRSPSVTSFKKSDVNSSVVAKSSSRLFPSSTQQPNSMVEKQDRPQWNMSAVKASRTAIVNKRSQPIMHSAKKSDNSLSTPIKMTQKDVQPTMTGRSQSILHSAIKTESIVSPAIKIKQRDVKPTMSGRSQTIMHSAKKTESTVPPPIKMKQNDGTPTESRRSQLIMGSAKKIGSSVSTSIKMKLKDAKSTTSGSALLCPSTKSSKEDEAVVASATVTEVEEVQSSQSMEIDAPSTNEGFDKTSDALDTFSSELQEVISSDIEIETPSTDELQGFDKTSDALDAVSSDIQKVISSSMNEEGYSSSGLEAVSSCTIDLGETCSSNTPDPLVEKTPVRTNMNTPKISDKLREISNSLKLLNARPLSVTIQKIAMEKTEEVAVEKTQELGMETAQVGVEMTQKVAMEVTQEVGMEYVQGTNVDEPEPKTPAIHLKFEQGADRPTGSFKGRSTGMKKSILKECLSFLNSATKEELKSLKGIGEKRANYIIELREESPELFKRVDDLKDVIGMNKKEIKMMMSGIIDSP